MKTKLLLLSVLCTLLITNCLKAQQKINFGKGLLVDNHALALPYLPQFKVMNEARVFNSGQELLQSISSSRNISGNKEVTSVEPANSIQSRSWGSLTNFETGTLQLYQMNYLFGTGANISMKLLDSELNVTNEFSIEIPSTTNSLSVISQTSNFNFEGNTKKKFMVFLHYFEGGSGPDFQKNSVWLFDETGTILHKFDDTVGTYLIKGTDGNTDILTYIDDETNVTMKVYKIDGLEQTASLQIESKYFTNYAGVPVNFINIGGQPKIVVCHYEKIYMDNNTLEVTPDNHLLMKILDNGLNQEKQISLPVPNVPSGSYVFGLSEFGMFYGDHKYDITDHVFNSDDNLEILYSIYYQDLINDKSWRNYYVADETGATIKSLEENVIDYYEMSEIEGHDDQISFILGDGDSGSSIKMFDIQSWNTVFDFPAVYNGEQLSVYYNRIPNNGGYKYLIGLGSTQQSTNGKYYGIVNKYSSSGELDGTVKLDIGTAPLSFTPLLYSDTLNPQTFNTDAEYKYAYVYSFQYSGSSTMYNSFNVSKDFSDPLITIDGNSTIGNISSSGLLLNENGDAYKLYINYYKSGSTSNTTEFYDIPLEEILHVSDAHANTVKVYTDRLNQIAGFTKPIKMFEVYSTSGLLIKSGGKTSSISTSGWPTGIYIIKFTTTENNTEATKILIP